MEEEDDDEDNEDDDIEEEEDNDDSGDGGDDDKKDDDNDEDKNEGGVDRDAIVVKSRETCEVSSSRERGGWSSTGWYIDSMNSKKPLLAHVM